MVSPSSSVVPQRLRRKEKPRALVRGLGRGGYEDGNLEGGLSFLSISDGCREGRQKFVCPGRADPTFGEVLPHERLRISVQREALAPRYNCPPMRPEQKYFSRR